MINIIEAHVSQSFRYWDSSGNIVKLFLDILGLELIKVNVLEFTNFSEKWELKNADINYIQKEIVDIFKQISSLLSNIWHSIDFVIRIGDFRILIAQTYRNEYNIIQELYFRDTTNGYEKNYCITNKINKNNINKNIVKII